MTAGRDAGYPWTDDYNGESQEGFGRLQMTIRKGRHESTASAYLRPARKRPNLTVLTRAMATRILMQDGRTTGIAYDHGGTAKTAMATREVLLAGGVINSPQLLMLSGIGARDKLGAHGIETVVDLPGVGKNLQDHVSVILMFRRKAAGPFHGMMRADRIALDFARTYLTGKGFSGDVPGGVVAFLKSDPGRPLPDVQMLFTAAPLAAWPWLEPFKKPFPDGFAMRIVAVQPESRGMWRWPRPTRSPHRASIRTSCPRRATGSRCAPGSASRAIWPRALQWRRSSNRNSFPALPARPMPRSTSISARPRSPSTTRRAPAGWGSMTDRSSTAICGYAASAVCGWLTPRSCRT